MTRGAIARSFRTTRFKSAALFLGMLQVIALDIALVMALAMTLVVALGGLNTVWAGDEEAGGIRVLDSKEPITYFIADGGGRTGYRPDDRELAKWALEAWGRSADGKLRFQAAPEATAELRLYWVEANDGQYGEMRPLTVGGRRGAAVFIQPDVESLGLDIARETEADPLLRDAVVYLTCVHEFGHALGLTHTLEFSDVMYYFGYGGDVLEFFGRYRAQLHSRSNIENVSGLSGADVSRIRALYKQK
jgi:hypothetical protein